MEETFKKAHENQTQDPAIQIGPVSKLLCEEFVVRMPRIVTVMPDPALIISDFSSYITGLPTMLASIWTLQETLQLPMIANI